jgi:hypothetical protein
LLLSGCRQVVGGTVRAARPPSPGGIGNNKGKAMNV